MGGLDNLKKGERGGPMILSVRTEPGVQKEDKEGKGWSHAGGCVRTVWHRQGTFLQ